MRPLTHILASILLLCLPGAALAQAGQDSIRKYSGMCEASAAVAVGSDRFLVANDEDNVLRLYQVDEPGAEPVIEDIAGALGLKVEEGADFEGAAELGGTTYWLTSHSRSKKGKIKPERFRFFAVSRKQAGGKDSFEVTGMSERLMKDLLESGKASGLGVDPLTVPEDSNLAPEKSGTNIEGLAAFGKDQLLIAFRNPVPGGQALLVPLENPARVIKGEKALFGTPIRLDLGKRGIRSIERLPDQTYLIAAGPAGSSGDFRLYRWSPGKPPEEIKGVDLAGLSPEAIVVYSDRKEVLLLSDDGDLPIQGKDCKEVPAEEKTFRARLIPLPR